MGETLDRIRSPIVLKRRSWHADTGEVHYSGRPLRRAGPAGGEARCGMSSSFSPGSSTTSRIRPSREVRCWGFYSSAARGKRRKAEPEGDTTQTPDRQDDDEFTRRDLARIPSWACLIRRVYEVDPLLCSAGARPRVSPNVSEFVHTLSGGSHAPTPTTSPEFALPPDALRKAISHTTRVRNER